MSSSVGLSRISQITGGATGQGVERRSSDAPPKPSGNVEAEAPPPEKQIIESLKRAATGAPASAMLSAHSHTALRAKTTEQVAKIPIWSYSAETGLVPAKNHSGPLPGCVIAKAEAGVAFPATIDVEGASYKHLRNGFYIGAHATDRDIAGLFDVLAPTYEKSEINVLYNLKVYRELSEMAQGSRTGPANRVLDFGCGTGLSAPVLSQRFPGAEVLGFDLSPKMRVEAKRNGMTPVDEKQGRLELAAGSVSSVVGAFVLHLVRDPAWIQEVARVLEPGGTATFNIYKADPNWRESFGTWFKEAGLEVVEAKEHTFSGGGLETKMPVVVLKKK